MAKDTKRVIDETVGAFKRLKEEVKQYKDELATLTAGSEEWRKKAEQLRNAQKQVDAINKAAKGTLTAYNKEQVNSINELKELIKQKNLERNAMDMSSKEYKEATAELKELNDKLREAGTSAGDWRANVGNYASSIKDAFGELGSAATGLSGNMGILNGSMLKLAANPLGAAVLALSSAISLLVKGIKSSEENTNAWNEAMVPLRTVMLMVERGAQSMAAKFIEFTKSLQESEKAGNIIQKVLQVIITVFNQTATRISNIKDGIVGVFNDVKGFVDRFKEWADGLKKTFEPVTEFVDKIANSLKTKLEPVVDWIVKQYNRLAQTNLGKVFGLQTIQQIQKSWDDAGKSTENAVGQYKEAQKEVRKVTKAENELNNTIIGLGHKRVQLQKELAEAQRDYDEALQKKDWTAAQEALNRATEKSIALAQTEVSIRAAEANVIRMQNALSGSTAEAKMAEARAIDAVTEATAGLDEARSRAANTQRQLDNLMKADTQQKKAKELAEAVKVLNAALKELETNYNNTVKTLETPIRPEGAEIDSNSLNSYYDAIKANNDAEYQAYVELTEAKIAELERFIEVQKAANQDVTTQELQLNALRKEQAEGYAQQYKKMVDGNTKADKERAKALTALRRSELQGYENLFDSVSGLFEENTVAYKATATAKALINTYLAATSALAETPGGAIAKGVAMAATLAAGLAQVIQIWKTNPKGETSVPNTNSSSTPAVAQPSLAETNPYTYTRQVQTVEEEQKLNQPLWISVQDINRVQERVRVTDQESTF